jgi:hypothetical protein
MPGCRSDSIVGQGVAGNRHTTKITIGFHAAGVHLKSTNKSYWVDETYIRIKGRWPELRYVR